VGKVVGEMTEWLTRPLEKVYPVIFIDAMVVKVRDGQVMNKPLYVVSVDASETSSGSGPAMAARARSSGLACSPRSRTAACRMSA
jgi:Transposase, Mutator family